jgi:hypothetical protein
VREREAVRTNLLVSAQDSTLGPGVSRAIQKRGEALTAREEELTRERNGILVEGRAPTPQDQERVRMIELELGRIRSQQQSLSKLAADVLAKIPKEDKPKSVS